jgi:hypothetical protein
LSLRQLEASDNYAGGCPGELNLVHNLGCSIMKEVEEVENEDECKICPEYWVFHDPLDE